MYKYYDILTKFLKTQSLKKGYKIKNIKVGMKVNIYGLPIVAHWLTNPTRNHKVASLIPGLAQWVKDPVLLWLW